MALNTANRASDARRQKWGSFRNTGQQESLVERLQREIDERPKSRYKVDEIVWTPSLGVRNISDRYYRKGSGWHYTFYTRNGLYTYKEKQLVSHGEVLLMQDVMKIIAAAG